MSKEKITELLTLLNMCDIAMNDAQREIHKDKEVLADYLQESSDLLLECRAIVTEILEADKINEAAQKLPATVVEVLPSEDTHEETDEVVGDIFVTSVPETSEFMPKVGAATVAKGLERTMKSKTQRENVCRIAENILASMFTNNDTTASIEETVELAFVAAESFVEEAKFYMGEK